MTSGLELMVSSDSASTLMFIIWICKKHVRDDGNFFSFSRKSIADSLLTENNTYQYIFCLQHIVTQADQSKRSKWMGSRLAQITADVQLKFAPACYISSVCMLQIERLRMPDSWEIWASLLKQKFCPFAALEQSGVCKHHVEERHLRGKVVSPMSLPILHNSSLKNVFTNFHFLILNKVWSMIHKCDLCLPVVVLCW